MHWSLVQKINSLSRESVPHSLFTRVRFCGMNTTRRNCAVICHRRNQMNTLCFLAVGERQDKIVCLQPLLASAFSRPFLFLCANKNCLCYLRFPFPACPKQVHPAQKRTFTFLTRCFRKKSLASGPSLDYFCMSLSHTTHCCSLLYLHSRCQLLSREQIYLPRRSSDWHRSAKTG